MIIIQRHIIRALTINLYSHFMRSRSPHCRFGLSVATAAGWLAAAPAIVYLVSSANAAELGLRPAFTATNYIRVVPVEPFSTSFVALIRDAAQQADAVQAAAARAQAERYGVDAVAGGQLPSGAFYGEVGLSTGPSPTPYAYGVRVSVPIYDGFSAGFATQAQVAMSNAAGHAAADELAATLVDLVAAAAAIRRCSELLDIRLAQRAAIDVLLSAIVSERTAGTASKVDTDQIESQLVQVEIEISAGEAALLEAKEAFARIAGTAPSHVGPIGSIVGLLPKNEAAAIPIALADNPQLAQRLELASAASFSTRSLSSSLGPDLSLDFSVGGTGDLSGAVASATEASVMFKLEVPFAFGTEAAVQQQALQAQAAVFEISAAEKGVLAGITSAYDRLASIRQSLALAYDGLDRSRNVRTGIAAERTLGERSTFDMLTAESAVADAEVRLAELRYEIVVAEHILAAQLGRLDDIYGVALR